MPFGNRETFADLRSGIESAGYASLTQGAVSMALQFQPTIQVTSAAVAMGTFGMFSSSTQQARNSANYTTQQQVGAAVGTLLTTALNFTLLTYAWSPLMAIAVSSATISCASQLISYALTKGENSLTQPVMAPASRAAVPALKI